jgi:F0F1-type ATP synthase epsilon subunit
MNNTLFHLKIASREGIVFEGEVESITSYNEKGKFDVLASHANFISLINKKIMIVKKDQKETQEINIETALMRVRENMVEVYLGVEGMVSGYQSF